MAFGGFPSRVRSTPVPNPLFGPLLEQIDDLGELKCTLRLIWLLQEKRGPTRYVTLGELVADHTLNRSLAKGGKDPRSEIGRALALAVGRGTFFSSTIRRDHEEELVYMLNTERNRKGLEDGLRPSEAPERSAPDAGSSEGNEDRPNIFALYEDNIGMLSPMIADKLKEAEELYPQSWIEEAFREAVSNNKRSWTYIAAILERWEREGRSNGRPVRSPKKTGYQEFFRR